VQQTITFIFFLGFPITLIMAWAYEITPGGLRADSGTEVQHTANGNSDRKLIYVLLGLVSVIGGLQISDRFTPSSNIDSTILSDVTISSAAAISTLSRRTALNIGITAPIVGPLTNVQLALSPDGSKLVYRVSRPDFGGEEYLYLKYLDQLDVQELRKGQSEGPFFSADGEWVAFGQNGGLHKISIRGGSPQLITEDFWTNAGGFWSSENTVFHSSDNLKLTSVSAIDNAQESLGMDEDRSMPVQLWPYLLPGEDALMFTAADAARINLQNGQINILVQSTGEIKTIIRNGYNARYAPSGHIVFVRDATLWAVPFDADKLVTTGPEQPVIQGVQTESVRGSAAYTFSDDGLLVYLPGEDTMVNGRDTSLIWVDREGNQEVLPQRRNFGRATVSPDGRQLAVAIVEEDGINGDIWIYDLTRDSLSRLTFDESDEYYPLWTPDGKRIIFGSTRDDGGLWWRAADGSGVAEPVVLGAPGSGPYERLSPYTFTPDGTQLLFTIGGNIFTVTIGEGSSSQPFMQSDFSTMRPDLSPDGNWLAYCSNESGRMEVYVRPFPNIDDGKWQISYGGGRGAKWSPNGLELYYNGPQNRNGESVWVARRDTENSSQFDPPVRVGEGSNAVVGRDTFDISANGERMLLRSGAENATQEMEVTSLVVVDNWFEELKRLAPAD
jgi:serine/threonine-protein kinase